MFIERNGDGPHVFFGLHGWSGDHRTFEPLISELPPAVRFYSADLPGCGASPAPPQWDLPSLVKTVADGIARLNTPVTLVGNCSGANLALFVAKVIPDLVERVVLIDAFAYWPWYFRVFVNPTFGKYAYFTTFANPIGRWLTNLSLRNRRQTTTSLTEGFERQDHRATLRFLFLLEDGGDVEQFRSLCLPIDIVFGQKSFRAVRESAAIFEALWPQARVRCLPHAGHLPIKEATSTLKEILFDDAAHFATRTEDPSCITQSVSCGKL